MLAIPSKHLVLGCDLHHSPGHGLELTTIVVVVATMVGHECGAPSSINCTSGHALLPLLPGGCCCLQGLQEV
jgi:hypothetical protein